MGKYCDILKAIMVVMVVLVLVIVVVVVVVVVVYIYLAGSGDGGGICAPFYPMVVVDVHLALQTHISRE
jgi:hypothetical protein